MSEHVERFFPSCLLALETTDIRGSIALFQNGELLEGRLLDPGTRSARSLFPGIEALLARHEIEPASVRVVAVAIGPGSFTGLRIGVTAAKLFAYATGARTIGVDTLLTIAAGIACPVEQGGRQTVSVSVDAQRGDVLAQRFEIYGGNQLPEPISEPRLLSFGSWCRNAREQGDLLAGPVLSKYRDKLPADLLIRAKMLVSDFPGDAPAEPQKSEDREGACFQSSSNFSRRPISAVDAAGWYPNAIHVGRIALHRCLINDYDDYRTLLPVYSRPPAPVEKRLSR